MNQSGRRAVDLYKGVPNKMQAFLQNRQTKNDVKIKELLKGNCDVGYFRDGKDDHKDEVEKRPET